MTEARIFTRSTADGTLLRTSEFSAIELCEASRHASTLVHSEILIRVDGQFIRKITKTEREALALRDRDVAYAIRDEIDEFTFKLANGKVYLENVLDTMTTAQREDAKVLWVIPGIKGGSLMTTLKQFGGNWMLKSVTQLLHVEEGSEFPSITLQPWGLPSTKQAALARAAA
jgi:hypothetical protein